MFTRTAAVTGAAAMSLVLAASLAGCATSAGGSGVTVASAKQKTIAYEKQISSYLPAADVTSTMITTTSRVIFPCLNTSGKSYWPGSTTLQVKNNLDTSDLLDSIAAKWNAKSGNTAFVSTSANGNKSLAMKTGDGYSFTVEFDQGPVFSITALSACFSNAGLAGKSSY
jgi:hypothetical protein